MVTFNSQAVVHASLDLLGNDPRIEIVVIDNLSVDRTVESIRTSHHHVRVIENDENAGFARAVNRAASQTRGRHILLLNPDALIDAAATLALAAELDRNPSIGAVSPLVGHDGSDVRVIAAGHSPTIWRMFLHESGMSRLSSRTSILEGHYLFRSSFGDALRDVDWVSGGCIMVPRAVWQDHAGLTERWFMYAEDVEFCLRLRASGLRVVVDPRVKAQHAIGGSSAGIDGRVTTAWIENLFDLYSWRIARNRISVAAWKAIVLVGFGGRWLVLHLRAVLGGSTVDRAGARRFRVYASGLLHARPSRVKQPLAIFRQKRNGSERNS
jgi:GT2 family glycosyltransferase